MCCVKQFLQAFSCTLPGMWGNVCVRSKHCISSCEQQAVEPTSPEPPWLSGPMQNRISSLPPPTACVDVRTVTDTWGLQGGAEMGVTGVHICTENKEHRIECVILISHLLFIVI